MKREETDSRKNVTETRKEKKTGKKYIVENLERHIKGFADVSPYPRSRVSPKMRTLKANLMQSVPRVRFPLLRYVYVCVILTTTTNTHTTSQHRRRGCRHRKEGVL